MKYLKSIVAFATLIFAASCAVDNIDMPSAKPDNGDQITIMGRITRFDDYEVSTRGVKHGDEGKITSMALAIFKLNDTEDGLAGNCEYYFHSASQQELLITITRGDLFEKGERYAMYVFCNMPGMGDFESGYFKDGVGGTSLADMLAKAYSVTDLNIPENGFPMIGSLGDTFSENIDKDGKEFILSPVDSKGDLTLPTINGTESDFLTIPMKAIYAKVNFSIAVDPDQTIEGNYTPQFSINSYTLCNVPTSVTFNKSTNSVGKTDVVVESVVQDLSGLEISGNQEAVGANTIDFSFYLPERLLTPATSADKYEYPFVKGTYSTQVDGDGNGYRDEDEKYFQRYKSKLVSDDQRATHICIEGTYRDHQNHEHNVAYTIYLGKDNYSDFNILRNGEYFNYVTIRGIQNADDMSNKDGSISIDHRVDIDRTEQPAIISLRREVLLDSHFEVRPLRIRANSAIAGTTINAVKVEVVNHETTNWMRIERSAGVGTDYAGKTNASGESIYITDEGPSKGKRRYFTYNLVDGKTPGTYDYPLVSSTEVIMPLTAAGDCVWIYVDECTDAADDVRTGKIMVTFGSLDKEGKFDGDTTNADYPPIEYIIQQRMLFPVTYGNQPYYIEYEEEYLHDFDADNGYGLTDYEGMPWGLPDTQLSHLHKDISVNASGLSGTITNNINNTIEKYAPYYDYYLVSDNIGNGEKHSHEGYKFCDEIVEYLSGKEDDMSMLTLSEKPASAIEYCYNKNKRDASGNVVMKTNEGWYLPAIDEIEEIVMSQYESTNSAGQTNSYYSYARFVDFQEKFYWSSQPAYNKNFVHVDRTALGPGDRIGSYMTDNTSHARATSVTYKDTSGLGPSDPKNYEPTLSTIYEGWSQFMYYNYNNDQSTVTDVTQPITVEWSNWTDGGTEILQPAKKHAGYKHRTNDMARVRCVRKMN